MWKCSKVDLVLAAVATLAMGTRSDAQSASSTYSYDALGRLTSVGDSTGTSQTYSYDAAGNRTQLQNSNSVLLPNQMLASGASLLSNDASYTLAMQGDGNLCVYLKSGGGEIWCSGTPNNPGAYAQMNGGGSLIVNSAAGAVLWSSPTSENSGASAVMQTDGNFCIYPQGGGSNLWCSKSADSSKLMPRQTLAPGQRLSSSDSSHWLAMQTDGNLCIYHQGVTGDLWCSGTQNNPGAWAVMQADGNLCIYPQSGGTDLWCSGTQSNPGAWVVMQADGNLCIYPQGGGTDLWCSGTAGK